METAVPFFRSTGWRVFARTLAIFLFVNTLSYYFPFSLLVGFDRWWHNSSSFYTTLYYPIIGLYGLPRYAIFIPTVLIFAAIVTWLWRTGRLSALLCAVLMTGFFWLLHTGFRLPI